MGTQHDRPTPAEMDAYRTTKDQMGTFDAFTLSIGPEIELKITAPNSGRTWNGHAVPILSAEQAAIIGPAIGEPDLQAGESDGLTWTRADNTRHETTLPELLDLVKRTRSVMDEQRDENGETIREANADLYREYVELQGYAEDCAMTAGEIVFRMPAK